MSEASAVTISELGEDGITTTGGNGSILFAEILTESEYKRNVNTNTHTNDEKILGPPGRLLDPPGGTQGGGGDIPRGDVGGRTGGVGGLGVGKRLAARNHWRGRMLQSGKSDGHLDRRGADGKGVRGISEKSERGALGSAPRRVEWGDARERSQCTRQGEQMRTDDERTGL